ncbi:MAG: site-specific DNA-methyltransferase [Endomicrobium sp.]|nr:site-specific DNA-methyltransferase [Endomicrobium sp.]
MIESPVEVTKENKHPVVYSARINKITVKKKDLVLDPFCGSGTTCIAAKKLNRKYLGIEINSEYVKLSEERLRKTDFQQEFYL